MPQAAAGNVIADSAQVNAGVLQGSDLANGTVTETQIAAGTITNTSINNSAAIAQSKLALSVTNSEINASAAIVDTKLATISTAGKINGAALTGLANIPSGAGVIPAANLPSTVIFKNGTTTKNASDASTTQNIAHGLGKTPSYVRLTAVCAYGTAGAFAEARTVYNGTTQSSVSGYIGNSTTCIVVTTFALSTQGVTGNNQTGVVTFDDTNIIINWTLNTNATGTYTILWEAFG